MLGQTRLQVGDDEVDRAQTRAVGSVGMRLEDAGPTLVESGREAVVQWLHL